MFTEEDLQRLRERDNIVVHDDAPRQHDVDCVIGIDPGSNTGFVVWDPSLRRLSHVDLTTFWGACDYIQRLLSEGKSVRIYMEDPSQARFTYSRNAKSGPRGARINRNVGKNQRDAELIKERFEEATDLHAIKPGRKKKWTAEDIKAVLGYPPPQQNPHYNNEHVRDAIRILYDHGVIKTGELAYLAE
jgi:hypothetical protein